MGGKRRPFGFRRKNRHLARCRSGLSVGGQGKVDVTFGLRGYIVLKRSSITKTLKFWKDDEEASCFRTP